MTFSPSDLAAYEPAIINACAQHEGNHRWDNEPWSSKDSSSNSTATAYQSLYPQIQTQKYVFKPEYAEYDVSAPRVAKILHSFHRDKMAYIVMEYIQLTTNPVPDLPQRVTLAFQWLRKLPPPHDHLGIGPLGGGHARHTVFKDCRAPLSFSSVCSRSIPEQSAATLILSRAFEVVAPVRISHEQLVFTQSDMDASNFGADDKGNTCLFDFGEVGLLPESFANHTMSSNAPFTVQVVKYLGWPSCPNLDSMSKIRGFLGILGDTTLGMSSCT
ncbi:hypothetical protein F5141DRAFT_1050428 [Pisolithus sp. B1]|nr:hypothetical protein F5141DRAFT_1050428 [Pisolithus sp. B1]